ncbi:hypothetical protein CLOSTASPAR_05398 [[Clostridium] asparagiforme DSM 15981]|uniref:Uncharacterized protein n=1 Tax=[Clostridium] asparagiforme DSM 15981 TaxID=518636 RepID=C0D800_9FIRM|nr:hypothetical protein CLOSTASPAR_05398 [[Clostridium] asparagiforme DSM 15981]
MWKGCAAAPAISEKANHPKGGRLSREGRERAGCLLGNKRGEVKRYENEKIYQRS